MVQKLIQSRPFKFWALRTWNECYRLIFKPQPSDFRKLCIFYSCLNDIINFFFDTPNQKSLIWRFQFAVPEHIPHPVYTRWILDLVNFFGGRKIIATSEISTIWHCFHLLMFSKKKFTKSKKNNLKLYFEDLTWRSKGTSRSNLSY